MKLFLKQFSAIISPHFKDVPIAEHSRAGQIPLSETD